MTDYGNKNAMTDPATQEERPPNRLITEASTYLRQHAKNPVDWYPWGKEALSRSKAEDKPILLSIGYSACHWCHVMAHESFESIEIARLMNQDFINVKVDREERPDLDDIYQKAAEAQAKQQASQAGPQQEAAPGGAAQPGQDEKVVDADYKVVDEEKK